MSVSMPPFPRACAAARAENANANALRIGDGVAGPTESAGDGGALSFLPPPPTMRHDTGASAKAGILVPVVGSRRCARACTCADEEGVNAGAAGLSPVFVFVFVLVSNWDDIVAPESGDDDVVFIFDLVRAWGSLLVLEGKGEGVRGALELQLSSGRGVVVSS